MTPKPSVRQWLDISDEYWRVYVWISNGEKASLRIDNPKRLMLSEDGSHRVETKGRLQYYVKPGWSYIQFNGEYKF